MTIVPILKDLLQFLKGQSKKIENKGENDEENGLIKVKLSNVASQMRRLNIFFLEP